MSKHGSKFSDGKNGFANMSKFQSKFSDVKEADGSFETIPEDLTYAQMTKQESTKDKI